MDLMREFSMTHSTTNLRLEYYKGRHCCNTTSARYIVGDKLRDWLRKDRAKLYGSHDLSWGMLISVMHSRVREGKVNLCTELRDWCQVTKVKRLITLFYLTALFHVWRQPRNSALIRKKQKHIFCWALNLDLLCFLTIILQPRGLPCSWLNSLTQNCDVNIYTAVYCIEGKKRKNQFQLLHLLWTSWWWAQTHFFYSD